MADKFSVAKITTKGQITIPKAIREFLGVEAGDHVAFIKNPDGSVEVRVPSLDGRK